MKKSVNFKIDGAEDIVVGYDKSTMVMFQICYNPHYRKGKGYEYSYYCHGMEWNEESYSIDFCKGEINERQRIEIEFGIEEKPNPDKPEPNKV